MHQILIWNYIKHFIRDQYLIIYRKLSILKKKFTLTALPRMFHRLNKYLGKSYSIKLIADRIMGRVNGIKCIRNVSITKMTTTVLVQLLFPVELFFS